MVSNLIELKYSCVATPVFLYINLIDYKWTD